MNEVTEMLEKYYREHIAGKPIEYTFAFFDAVKIPEGKA